MKPRYRLGLMCNKDQLLLWEKRCLEHIVSTGLADFVVIIEKKEKVAQKSFLKKLIDYPFSNFVYRLYDRFCKASEALNIGWTDFMVDVPRIECEVIEKGRNSEYLKEDDLKMIGFYNLDIIIRFGFNILRGDILTLPTYGVWSYHHSDEEKYRGGPAFFWEIVRKDYVTGAILQRLTEDIDGGVVLRKGKFSTVSHSFQETANTVYYHSALWIKQVLIDLANAKAEYIHNLPVSNDHVKLNRSPSNLVAISFFLQMLINKLQFYYQELFCAEFWNVAIVKMNIKDFLNSPKTENVTWLEPPVNSDYYADPFLFQIDNKPFLLIENYSYKLQKANVCQIDLSDYSVSEIANKSTHLSYPFTVCFDNEWYFIPESFQENCVNLYQFDKQTLKWNWKKKILDGYKAVDSTLFQYEDYWWLFCTKEDDLSNVNLHAFYSSSIEGPYTAHANNPIKTDITSARPAGQPFIIDEVLYRPSQDCSKSYGSKLIINKILKLNPEEFHEITSKVINPIADSPYPDGIHHVSFHENRMVIDGKRYAFSFYNFINKIKTKLIRSNKA